MYTPSLRNFWSSAHLKFHTNNFWRVSKSEMLTNVTDMKQTTNYFSQCIKKRVAWA